MPFATVNDVRLFYELHGSAGEPLVLVHGFTGDRTDWRYQVTEFSSTYRVLVIDNRGHGRSEAPRGRSVYTVEHMADDVEQLVDRVGFECYHLVGHSMGGAAAQEIALRSPEKLLSLTLQDTTDCAGDHEDGTGTPPYVPPEGIDEAKQRIAWISPDALAGAWSGWIEWRGTKERAHQIRTPALVIYGDRDASKIFDGSARLAELIPNAEVQVIPRAGHSPHLECPEAFNAALRRHLEGAGKRRAHFRRESVSGR